MCRYIHTLNQQDRMQRKKNDNGNQKKNKKQKKEEVWRRQPVRSLWRVEKREEEDGDLDYMYPQDFKTGRMDGWERQGMMMMDWWQRYYCPWSRMRELLPALLAWFSSGLFFFFLVWLRKKKLKRVGVVGGESREGRPWDTQEKCRILNRMEWSKNKKL